MERINIRYIMLLVSLLLGCGNICTAQQTSGNDSSGNRITVFTIGDSTMANKKAEVAPETGWCQAFPAFVDQSVEIKNRAVNGRSTKSFIAEGRWKAVLDSLKEGDYVFIQFGHNDEKIKDSTRYTDPFTTYAQNIERFIRETREKKAHPILFTPIVRRKFENGFLIDTHGNYPVAVRQMASIWSVPLIDLQLLTEGAVTALGEEATKNIYLYTPPTDKFPKGRADDTHLKLEGATLVAKLAAQQLKLLGNSLSEKINIKSQN